MRYIAYCRKSSESEERQMLSIDAQVHEVQEKASHDGVHIEKFFKESMSAKAPGRPVFKDMMNYIEKNGPCIIYTWKLDRLTRNAKDGGEVSWFMDKGLISEIRTYDKTILNNPNDKFLLTLDFGIAKKFVDDLSANVKRGNFEKLRQGGWPGTAPFGYLNNKADNTVYPDLERAHYVRNMFQLYATGTHGLKDLEQMLYDEGLRSRGGYRVRHSVIHRVLQDPFYYGLMRRGGKTYVGNHEPIISKELFDQVQKASQKRKHTHNEKHMFVHRDFLFCETCGCKYTATLKKGFIYYYCTNGKKVCTEHKKYMREEQVDSAIAEILDLLHVDSELIDLAYLANKEKMGMNQEYQRQSEDHIEKQLQMLHTKQAKLLDGYLADLIPEELYTSKIEALRNEVVSLEQQKKNLEKKNGQDPETTLEHIKNIFLAANQAKKDFLNAKEDGKRHLLEILLWNVTIEDGNVAEVSFKNPFELIAKTSKKDDFAAVQAQ